MRRLGVLVVLAAAGVLGGHALAYGLVHGDPGAAQVGDHGYLPLAARVAVPAALLAFASLVLANRRASRPGFRHLAGLQVVGFTIQEACEHLLSGNGLEELTAQPVLWVGLALQLVVAVLVIVGARAASMVVDGLWCLRRERGFGVALPAVAYAPTPPRVALPAPTLRSSPPRAPPLRLAL